MKRLHNIPKRTLKDVDVWLTPQEVLELITRKSWPYKSQPQFYLKRDRALMALLFVTGARNNELLSLYRGDFVETEDFLIIKKMKISKRSRKVIQRFGPKVALRDPIRLPKYKHPLESFTRIVLEYLVLLRSELDKLFKFGTRREHQIVYYCTGKWPHWFRAMSENYYGKLFGDAVQLAKFIGVRNVQSVMPYIPFDEEAYVKALKRG